MAVMQLMPRGADWTVEDLERLPEGDGLQYELFDGMLVVSPSPTSQHGTAVFRLANLIGQNLPEGRELVPFVAPMDWQPGRQRSLQPDLLIARAEDVQEKKVVGPLVLAVEVLSPSTRNKDLLLKRDFYQQGGVRSYWIVDPDEPSVLALELRDGVYYETGKAAGDEELVLSVPFPITIVPSALVTR